MVWNGILDRLRIALRLRDPPGFARDLALRPAWMIDRHARSTHPSVNSSGASVRVALALSSQVAAVFSPPLASPGDCEATHTSGNRLDPPVCTSSAGCHTLASRSLASQASETVISQYSRSAPGRQALQFGLHLLGISTPPEAARRSAPGQLPSLGTECGPPLRRLCCGKASRSGTAESTGLPTRSDPSSPARPHSARLLVHTLTFSLRSFRRTRACNAPQPPVLANISHPCPPACAPRKKLDLSRVHGGPATLWVTADQKKCPDVSGPRL